jgi:hypothetical protein
MELHIFVLQQDLPAAGDVFMTMLRFIRGMFLESTKYKKIKMSLGNAWVHLHFRQML